MPTVSRPTMLETMRMLTALSDAGDVLGDRGELGDLGAGRQPDVVEGDDRAGLDVDDLAVDAVLTHRGLKVLGLVAYERLKLEVEALLGLLQKFERRELVTLKILGVLDVRQVLSRSNTCGALTSGSSAASSSSGSTSATAGSSASCSAWSNSAALDSSCSTSFSSMACGTGVTVRFGLRALLATGSGLTSMISSSRSFGRTLTPGFARAISARSPAISPPPALREPLDAKSAAALALTATEPAAFAAATVAAADTLAAGTNARHTARGAARTSRSHVTIRLTRISSDSQMSEPPRSNLGSSSLAATKPTTPPGRPGSGPTAGTTTASVAETAAVIRMTPSVRTMICCTGLCMARRVIATPANTMGIATARPKVRSVWYDRNAPNGPVMLLTCSFSGQTAWLGASAGSKVTSPAARNSQTAPSVSQPRRAASTAWSLAGGASSLRR
jgi:hypothetical protein